MVNGIEEVVPPSNRRNIHEKKANTVESLYLELARDQIICSRQREFEIERVRDRERKIGYSLHKGTKTLVRDREKFEIEGVRDRESQLYFNVLR